MRTHRNNTIAQETDFECGTFRFLLVLSAERGTISPWARESTFRDCLSFLKTTFHRDHYRTLALTRSLCVPLAFEHLLGKPKPCQVLKRVCFLTVSFRFLVSEAFSGWAYGWAPLGEKATEDNALIAPCRCPLDVNRNRTQHLGILEGEVPFSGAKRPLRLPRPNETQQTDSIVGQPLEDGWAESMFHDAQPESVHVFQLWISLSMHFTLCLPCACLYALHSATFPVHAFMHFTLYLPHACLYPNMHTQMLHCGLRRAV